MTKIAVITGFLGEVHDRFCVYNKSRSILEKLETAAAVPGVDGVEIIYPYDFQDPKGVEDALARLSLGVSAVNVNVKSEPEFAAGSLTSPDPAIRERATGFLRQGMDTAARLGCNRVTVCPLSDGHDYAFQLDYEEEWRRLRDCLAGAAAYRTDVMVSLEYKPSETRVKSTAATAMGATLLIKEIGLPNLGVTVDVGHSLYGGENPAQALSLLYHHGIRPYMHVNDNYRNWDWDLIPGTVNFWDLIEVFWVLTRHGYEDWFTLDVFPARLEPEECFATSARIVRTLAGIARKLDPAEIASLRARGGQAVPGLVEYVWRTAGVRLGDEGE